MLLLTFALTTLSVVAAPPSPAQSELARAVSSVEDVDLPTAIENIERAIDRVRQHPEESPTDGSVSEALLDAYVLLIRLQIANADLAAAEATADELIRIDEEQRAPIRAYGPSVVRLHDARRQALAPPSSTLRIECSVACAVVVDGRRLLTSSTTTRPGDHVVWIAEARDSQDATAWVREDLVLKADQTHTLVFPEVIERDSDSPGSPPKPSAHAGPAPPSPTLLESGERALPLRHPAPPPKRLAPRVAELVALGVGLGTLAAGVSMLAVDGRCASNLKKVTAYTNPQECESVFGTSQVAGAVLTAAGGVAVLSSTVLVGIDEFRPGRGGQFGVTARVTLRF
ncbi:hypothetical protein [Enhygromyxa salina]|uniref:hypothetical protein n=1 Tax=Enhygromyxa salina TaxID=215803 RepID=UPI00069621C4|nr:hypothetical protein [Enhygromyxa salina]